MKERRKIWGNTASSSFAKARSRHCDSHEPRVLCGQPKRFVRSVVDVYYREKMPKMQRYLHFRFSTILAHTGSNLALSSRCLRTAKKFWYFSKRWNYFSRNSMTFCCIFANVSRTNRERSCNRNLLILGCSWITVFTGCSHNGETVKYAV